MKKELTDLIPVIGWWKVAGRIEELEKEENFKTSTKKTLKEIGYYGIIGLYNVAILSTAYKIWYDSLPLK